MKKLATLLVGYTLAVSAHAATVSFSFFNPLEPTEISQSGPLRLFDSSLGTLLGATLEVNGHTVMNFSGTNASAQTRSATLSPSVELSWSSSLGSLNAFLNDTLQLSATSGLQSYAAGETKNFGPFDEFASLNDDLASILPSLQVNGGGLFDVTCRSLSSMVVQGGGGNIATTQSTDAGCGASIVYTYTEERIPVPEPGSLALLGIGIAGLGLNRRRKA